VPSPESVTSHVDIAAAVSGVWDLLATPGHLEECHPFCRENPVFSWNDEDRRDGVIYFSGLVLHRRLFDWQEGRSFDLHIGPPGEAPTNLVQWRLEPARGGAATWLTVTVLPLGGRLQRAILHSYLDSVVRGVRYRVETGQRVRRNQFGPHRVFSPAVPGSP
jgi:hypothetical protein